MAHEDCCCNDSVHATDVLELIRLFKSGSWLNSKKWDTVRLICCLLHSATHYADTRPIFGSFFAPNDTRSKDQQLDDLAELLDDSLGSGGFAGPLVDGDDLLASVQFCWMLLQELEPFE